MNVLIDTQVLIWIHENNPAISKSAHAALTNLGNRIHVSQISLIEVAIKLKVGKLPDFQVSTEELISKTVEGGIYIVQLANHHIATYNSIPLYTDHGDPFDRLILATALAENMPVISADEKFIRYRDVVNVIW